MRNFWVAIIGVLTITLFAGTSFATAPMVQDIPDFKLLTGSQLIDDFDLNDYVTDYDDPVSSLDWTIDGTPFNATLSDPTSNLLSIAGSSSVGQGVNAFRVHDATQSDAQSVDTSVVKYSSIMVSGPGLTQDNNLVPPNAFARTWVVEATRTITTPAIYSLISPAITDNTPDLFVSIADLNGNLLAGEGNVASATSGDLTAAINGSGQLELSAPAGKYPLTGPFQLTGAYRVGIKAKLTGGVGEANWDGAELLVSTSRLPTLISQSNLDRLDRFNSFEVATTGALPISTQDMRLLEGAGNNANWYSPTRTGAATAQIVASAPTSSTTTWASSGKAVKITLTAAGELAVIRSEYFTDIQPGEKLTFQANVTTSIPAGQKPVDIWMFMGPFSIPSNYQGTALAAGNQTINPQVPVGGADGWRTLKTTFVADTFGASVQGATQIVNFYAGGQRAGQQANISVVGPASVTYPVDVYVDNVRIYRNGSDLDNALAATAIPVVYNATKAVVFNGTFEDAADLSKLQVVSPVGTGAAVLDTNVGNNSPFHNGNKSLAMYIPGAATRSSNSASLVRITVSLDATNPAVGGKDYRGNGIFGFSFWFKTDAPDVKSTPGIMAFLADNFYKNMPFADTGYVGCPLAGQGWKKVEVSSARLGANVLVGCINVRTSVPGTIATNSWWGEFKDADKKPGLEEDATVSIDDVKFHKVLDEATYFDRSVFPVLD